jgi:hypothetical protein
MLALPKRLFPLLALLLLASLAAAPEGLATASSPTLTSDPSTATGSQSTLESLLNSISPSLTWLGVGIWDYLSNRVLDMVDMFEVNVGFGFGVKVGMEFGLGRTSLGFSDTQRIGMDGRQWGLWSEKNAAFGYFPLSLAFAPFELSRSEDEPWKTLRMHCFEAGTVGVEWTKRENFLTTAKLYDEAQMAGPAHERVGDCFAIGGEMHMLVIGARMRIKPAEMVDFFLGFVGIDLDRDLVHRQDNTIGLEYLRSLPVLQRGTTPILK